MSFVQLTKYRSLATGDIYHGYPLDESETKIIDNVVYIRVISNLAKKTLSWVRRDGVAVDGKEVVDVS